MQIYLLKTIIAAIAVTLFIAFIKFLDAISTFKCPKCKSENTIDVYDYKTQECLKCGHIWKTNK